MSPCICFCKTSLKIEFRLRQNQFSIFLPVFKAKMSSSHKCWTYYTDTIIIQLIIPFLFTLNAPLVQTNSNFFTTFKIDIKGRHKLTEYNFVFLSPFLCAARNEVQSEKLRKLKSKIKIKIFLRRRQSRDLLMCTKCAYLCPCGNHERKKYK